MPSPSRTEGAPDCLRLGAGQPAARQVVTVPGHQVPIIHLDLPRGLRGQAREQVAQRQLADRTGQRTGLTLRPCPPLGRGQPRHAGDRWEQALVADASLLSQVQDLTCQAVLPDYMTLPTAPDVWTLAHDRLPGPDDAGPSDAEDILMARLGPADGFSAQPALVPALLSRALTTGPRPKAMLLLNLPAPLAAPLQVFAEAENIPVVQDPAALSDLGLPKPQVLAHGELACDLRQNPMAARNRLEQRLLPWRWPLLALALAAALWASTQILAQNRIASETRALTAQTTALVQQHFVPQGPVLDIRLQVSRQLDSLRAAANASRATVDPLALAAAVGDVVAAAGLHPDALSYTREEGLLLSLRLADFAAVETLQANLRSAALDVTLRDSRVREGQPGVQAEFLITPANGGRP